MPKSLWICIIILAVSDAIQSFQNQMIEPDQNDAALEIAGFSRSGRDKRAINRLAQLGFKIARALLYVAKPIDSKRSKLLQYEKPGDINTALRDFNKVLESTQKVKFDQKRLKSGGWLEMWTAKVGDHTFRLTSKRSESLAYEGNPVIEVTKTKVKDVKKRKRDPNYKPFDKVFVIIYKKDFVP